MDTACPPPAFGGHMTCGQKPAVDMEGTIYRLYRAQRLYAQLLPKSMLIAILIDNGIRLQSTIALCPEKGLFMSYFTRHKGSMSISRKFSEHKGCMSFSVDIQHLCSKRIGRSVIIRDVNSRQNDVEHRACFKKNSSLQIFRILPLNFSFYLLSNSDDLFLRFSTL